MSHTPGPWIVNKDWIGEIKGPDGALIAGVCRTGEEQDSNARLIAVAPELLEAAKAAKMDKIQHQSTEGFANGQGSNGS